MSTMSWKEDMHDVGPALRTKYQRLLEAYQKSKKENQVLKKVRPVLQRFGRLEDLAAGTDHRPGDPQVP